MVAAPERKVIAIDTYYYSRPGRRHRERGEQNQDAVLTAENEKFRIFAMADGVSACKNGGSGARTAAAAGCDFLLRLGSEDREIPPQKTAALLMEEILYQLRAQSQREGAPLASYASTLTVCKMEKGPSPAVQICHLGDSGLLLCDGRKQRHLSMLPRQACHTTTPGAERTMLVASRKLLPGQHLCLCSDGFLELLKDPQWRGPVKEALYRADPEALRQQIDGADPEDDCTFLLISREAGWRNG